MVEARYDMLYFSYASHEAKESGTHTAAPEDYVEKLELVPWISYSMHLHKD